jgi:sugar fermentation stimulation protein A
MVTGSLIRRYKRFLADVRLADGKIVTVHCPNTGSMKNCTEENAEVWLSVSDNPKRKYAFTWEYIKTSRGHYIGINTGRANKLVEQALESGVIGELRGYQSMQKEVRYGDENSRIDLYLSGHARKPDCYVEVKSVTLLEQPVSGGIGYFPDAVSERGAKHLRELKLMKEEGKRAVLLFCVQHTGIKEVRPADHIDEHYGELLRNVARQGVEILAYKVRMTSHGFRLWRKVPVTLA